MEKEISRGVMKMEFMTVDKFLYDKPYYNNIIALRVQDEKVYFVGWMEDAKNYKINWMNKGNELDLSSLLLNEYSCFNELISHILSNPCCKNNLSVPANSF